MFLIEPLQRYAFFSNYANIYDISCDFQWNFLGNLGYFSGKQERFR